MSTTRLFRSRWRRRVAEAVYEVVEELVRAGVERFTVRQLFYQLVARGVLENTRLAYKHFDEILVRLREDDPELDERFIDTSKPRFDYYVPRLWRGQRYFVELWIEKDALRGFFEPYARRYGVNLVVCRGYPSVTRLREAKQQRGVPPGVRYVVLYFGDFDPSGEDIFRWINEELRPYDIEVVKVALTREQVERYRLPPAIPKRSDPRYRGFVEEHGEIAVELDALHPVVLRDIIRQAILSYMDVNVRARVEAEYAVEAIAERIVDEVLAELRSRLSQELASMIASRLGRDMVEAVVRQSILDGREPSLVIDRAWALETARRLLRELVRLNR